MKKGRFFYLHPECNPGKIAKLDALHARYVEYVNICIDEMTAGKKCFIKMSELQKTFTKAKFLTNHLQRSARFQAVEMVSGWIRMTYGRVLKKEFFRSYQSSSISDSQYKSLCTIGKYLVSHPSDSVTNQDIDLFWRYLTDENLVGRQPRASDGLPMELMEKTCRLEIPKTVSRFPFLLRISTLERGKRTIFPLGGNPYVNDSSEVSKSIQAQKDWKGRWKFTVVEKKDHSIPVPEGKKTGVDIGLNVLAATSDGRTFGKDFKPKFNKKYERLQNLRKNRQRQGILQDSHKLRSLERNLSGFTKTAVGTVANQLVRDYPGHTFVIEDLDLRGCKGQKRFAYRALQKSLESKATIEVVNPAYTSQTCPSCGFVSSKNRSGIKFRCRSCGRKSHADVVGAINLLGRSEEKQISCKDHPFRVRDVLRRLYWARRNSNRDCPSDFWKTEPSPSGRKLTTRKHNWQSFKKPSVKYSQTA